MKDSLEHIIEDIYTLEPTLREQDTEVRALVSSLVSAKPAVAVDDAFVRELRRDLLSKLAPAQKAVISPFMKYLAPLGAMVVLVLMIVPGYLTNKTIESPTVLPEIMNTEMPTDVGEGAVMKRSAEVVPEAASMMMAPSDDLVIGDTVTVFDQVPGPVVELVSVTLTAPGFVVIHADDGGVPGDILGVSRILFAETTDSIKIPLTIEMVEDAWYFVTVYHDDGDGVFAPEADYQVLDVYTGTPLWFMFGATLFFPQ